MAPYFMNNAALQSTSLRLYNPSPLPFLETSSDLRPRLNISEDDGETARISWRRHNFYNFALHESSRRCTYSEYTGQNSALAEPPIPPGFDYSRFCFLPDHNPRAMSKWRESLLLSLPKELRLEIWSYVLTDTSVPDLAVEITRAPRSPSKSSLRFPTPYLKASLQPARNAPIGLNLLLTSKFVYEEALPILYKSVKFAPLDLEGIFPLFLDTLSPYGCSLIRHVKLRIPSSIYDIDLFGDPSTFLFHWAVTCAQVAKMENLRHVEVEGFEDHESKRVRNGILNPLVKIKARKVFVGSGAQKAQARLTEARAELLAQASARKRSTEAERTSREARIAVQKASSYAIRKPSSKQPFFTHRELVTLVTPHAIIEEDLSGVKGLAQFEKELDEHTQGSSPASSQEGDEEEAPEYGEWDIVSVESGASTPRLPRATSPALEESVDEFTDTASILVHRVSNKSL